MAGSDEVMEELEALLAILEENTVEVVRGEDTEGNNRPSEIIVHITPLTASEQEKQYVSLSLVIRLHKGYPHEPPLLGVRNPRGLEDSAVAGLLANMNSRCEEYRGCPVLFELIELAREFLTSRNVPVCQCIICLHNIQKEESFTKTECLHFFHKHCLGRYITNMQQDYQEQLKVAEDEKKHTTLKEFSLTCPVCRERIGESRYNLAELLAADPPLFSNEEQNYSIGEEVKLLQEKMKQLFLRQKNKGGIIDLEAEEKKYLVLTGSSQPGDTFTELCPTDFTPEEPAQSSPHHVSQSATPEQRESPSHHTFHHYRARGGKANRGHSHSGGAHTTHQEAQQSEELTSEERRERNAYRKNHFLNRGKSHHQVKKSSSGGEKRPDNRPGAPL